MFIVFGFWILSYASSYVKVGVRNPLARNIDEQITN